MLRNLRYSNRMLSIVFHYYCLYQRSFLYIFRNYYRHHIWDIHRIYLSNQCIYFLDLQTLIRLKGMKYLDKYYIKQISLYQLNINLLVKNVIIRLQLDNFYSLVLLIHRFCNPQLSNNIHLGIRILSHQFFWKQS